MRQLAQTMLERESANGSPAKRQMKRGCVPPQIQLIQKPRLISPVFSFTTVLNDVTAQPLFGHARWIGHFPWSTMHQRLGSGIQDVPLDTHGASKRGIESR